MRIGLLSDTHGSLPEKASEFFAGCDEIWHAGDFGNEDVAARLRQMAPLRGVYGNIDGMEIRTQFPETAIFSVEGLRVVMIHIGGYPGRYTPKARTAIRGEHPGLFISGHSHILKVMFDKKNNLLHINPGAAGKSGFHRKITMVRFTVNNGRMKDLEIFEKDR